MSGNRHNCAMVFAHPGHELLAVGLLQRHRPHILYLTRADSAGDEEREALAREGLERLELSKQATFLGVPEGDVHRWLLQGDVASILELRGAIADWLRRIEPMQVFGDAFELTNVVHDLGRAILDSAWRERFQRVACANFELPLVCRTDPEPWKLRFQEFPDSSFESISLTQAELKIKQSLADWIGTRRMEAEMARPYFDLGKEIFRQVPADRDYSVPPEGLQRHYDEWGQIQVQLGKYAQPILFADHFVPLVQQLPQLS